jgi:hypothetical protein
MRSSTNPYRSIRIKPEKALAGVWFLLLFAKIVMGKRPCFSVSG